MRASTLYCFHNLSTHMFRNFTDGADSMRFISAISVDRSAEIRVECPFNGVTNYGRIWKKGAGKRGLECDPVHGKLRASLSGTSVPPSSAGIGSKHIKRFKITLFIGQNTTCE